jgi:L-threonylcarbamoyladenylate synthase
MNYGLRLVWHYYKREKMARINLFWDVYQDIERLAQSLQLGNVSLGSSDTVLGLMAPVTKIGHAGLNAAKERAEKPYIVLARDLQAVERYAILPESGELRTLLEVFWPGPLTVILKKKEGALPFLETPGGTVAFRVPQHAGLQQLLGMVDTVFSTSANKAGKPVPLTFADVHPEILGAVDCVVKDRDAHETAIPSTIIDCSAGQLVLVREGVIPFSGLQNKT